MTNDFKIQRATRRGVIPVIGIYGGPGVGKTKSALLLARGFVGDGPSEDICLIDTESRRGSIYADEIPGGYSAIDLTPPFSPLRYMDAMRAGIDAGAKILIDDSMSHCWEGEGGVCDMANQNEERTGKPGLHNWTKPKREHAMMLQFMLRSPVPIICCMRAKQKTKQTKDETGKKVIRKDDFYTPITEAEFAFELTMAIEIFPDHTLRFTKKSLESLSRCFPDGAPIETKHGAALAKWCAAGGQPVASSTPEDKANKKKLWDMTQHIHKGDTTALEAFLVNCNLLEPGVGISSVTGGKLKTLVAQTEEEMKRKK